MVSAYGSCTAARTSSIVFSAMARARRAPSASTAWTWSGLEAISRRLARKGSEGLVEILGEELLAIHATDACPAALDVDHFHVFPGGENLVHREDIAHIRVAGIGAIDALRVGDHHHHPFAGLIGCERQFDVVVQALAHLFLAVDAEHLGNLGVLHAGLDQHVACCSGN